MSAKEILKSTNADTGSGTLLLTHNLGWKTHFLIRSAFSLVDAAFIVSNIDPCHSKYLSGDQKATVDRWGITLRGAIRSGGLRAYESRLEEWRIKADDLRDYCKAYGWSDPFLEVSPTPTNEAELSEVLRLCEAQLSSLGATRDDLVAELAKAKAEIEALKLRINEKSDDEPKGKSRAMMLRLIGAMASGGYRIDIRANKKEVGRLQAALQSQGVQISTKALSEYLSEAAKLLD